MFSSSSAHRRRGFTLVELLVVVAIIALLIAVLMPSLSRARRTAQRVVCMSNMRQIGIALALYRTDNKRHMLPPFYNGYSATITSTGVPEPGEFPYHNGDFSRCAPWDWNGGYDEDVWYFFGLAPYIPVKNPAHFENACPEKPQKNCWGYFPYGLNTNLRWYYLWHDDITPRGYVAPSPQVNIDHMRASSEICMLIESYEPSPCQGYPMVDVAAYGEQCDGAGITSWHHYEGLNVVYLDGHASWLRTRGWALHVFDAWNDPATFDRFWRGQ